MIGFHVCVCVFWVRFSVYWLYNHPYVSLSVTQALSCHTVLTPALITLLTPFYHCLCLIDALSSTRRCSPDSQSALRLQQHWRVPERGARLAERLILQPLDLLQQFHCVGVEQILVGGAQREQLLLLLRGRRRLVGVHVPLQRVGRRTVRRPAVGARQTLAGACVRGQWNRLGGGGLCSTEQPRDDGRVCLLMVVLLRRRRH